MCARISRRQHAWFRQRAMAAVRRKKCPRLRSQGSTSRQEPGSVLRIRKILAPIRGVDSRRRMAELPKIIRRGLAQPEPAAHPDADLLTAFAEHALAGSERKKVLEHLSACSACRDIVTLSLPQAAEAQPGASRARVSPRSRWSVLRWGALAASLTVVVAAVLLRYPQREIVLHEHPSARVDGATSPASREQAETAAANKAVTAGTRAKARKAQEQPPTLAKSRPERGTPPEAAGRPSKGLADSYAAGVPSAAPEVKIMANAPQPAGAAAAMTASGEAASKANDKTSGAAAVAGEPAVNSARVVAKAPMRALPASAPTGGALATQSKAERARVDVTGAQALRWSVSASGQLMRSRDGGATWEPVVVDRAGAPVLRAVFAGPQGVWTGGNGGALYFSAAAGATWKRVQPATRDGVAVLGTMTRIEFADAARGTLTVRYGDATQT